MDVLHNLMEGFATLVGSGLSGVAWWEPSVVIVAGIMIGIFVGVMPGLSASTGVALMVPFTYGMHPLIALILLAAVYTASRVRRLHHRHRHQHAGHAGRGGAWPSTATR